MKVGETNKRVSVFVINKQMESNLEVRRPGDRILAVIRLDGFKEQEVFQVFTGAVVVFAGVGDNRDGGTVVRDIGDDSESSDTELRLRPVELSDNIGGANSLPDHNEGAGVAGLGFSIERLLDARVAN